MAGCGFQVPCLAFRTLGICALLLTWYILVFHPSKDGSHLGRFSDWLQVLQGRVIGFRVVSANLGKVEHFSKNYVRISFILELRTTFGTAISPATVPPTTMPIRTRVSLAFMLRPVLLLVYCKKFLQPKPLTVNTKP